MTGMKARSFVPLINVSLEDRVPAGQFYQDMERTLDLMLVRDLVCVPFAERSWRMRRPAAREPDQAAGRVLNEFAVKEEAIRH
jgi:hypothetical protein